MYMSLTMPRCCCILLVKNNSSKEVVFVKKKDNTQITVYKTAKGLLEANDALMKAHTDLWRHIHARKCKDEKKKKLEDYESGIFLNGKDYSEGTGDKSQDAYVFISATDAKYIHRQIYICKKGELYKAEKIGKDLEDGKSTVTKITIARYETDPQGKPRKLPYLIQIENGSGEKATNSNGGTYCKSGSYICESKVNINMSDHDCFTFFEEIYTLIRIYELRWQVQSDLGTLYASIKKVLGSRNSGIA